MSVVRHIVRISYVIFVLALAVATFIEWQLGTSFAHEVIYGSWWFIAIIAVMSVASSVIFVRALRSNKPAMLVHLALLTILAGAFTTHILGVQGTMYLRKDVRTDVYLLDDGTMRKMPFGVTLTSFDVCYYPGTDAAMDYRSEIVTDDGLSHVVSMNNVFSSRGFRFYQNSYTDEGSVLTVNYDPLGIAITYLGYILLALGFILVLANPRGRFRTLLKSLSVCCLMFVVGGCVATEDSLLEDVPTTDEAQCVEESLLMLYNDRIVPIETYAIDFTLKVTGRRSYGGLTPMQFLLGWYSQPAMWDTVACIEVNETLPEECGISSDRRYISLAELFDGEGRYKLEPYFAHLSERPPKSVRLLNDKVQLLCMLTSGESMKLFPHNLADSSVLWRAAEGDSISETLVADLRNSLSCHDMALLTTTCESIATVQQSRGGESLPSATRIYTERCHNKLQLTKWLFMLCLTFGMIFLFVNIYAYSHNREYLTVRKIQTLLVVFFFVFQTTSLVMRAVISGNIPLASGHETMLFLSWSLLLVTLVMRNVIPLFRSMGMLLAGFTLLVAHIGLSNPHITPLMPVLHSPWLSSHVATIMMSYAIFVILAVNGVIGLTAIAEERSRKVADISLVLLYVAVVLLSVGIFIGAVWANESWGRYWAWDPKEVWALITLLVYAVPLHPSLVRTINNPKVLHIYLLCALSTVLMTYFGVNYLLGGMHSYGA